MSVHYTLTVTPKPLSDPGRSQGEYRNGYAFAVIKTDGSVVTWGDSSYGGDSSLVASDLAGAIDVTQIFSTKTAFAALRTDGSVVTWGESYSGGDSSAVASALAGEIDVMQIYSTFGDFAALRTDGSVITWGDSNSGDNSSAVANALSGDVDVTQIYSTLGSFAALRADGSVVTWGSRDFGGHSTAVASALSGDVDVMQIYSTAWGFVALRVDRSVVTWGASGPVARALFGAFDVIQIYSTNSAFAALRADGSVVSWGVSTDGGNSSVVASALSGEVDVMEIFSAWKAFAALRADGSVVTWGDSYYGGDSSAVASALAGEIDVMQIYSNYGAFAALRADGSVVTWGDSDYGGDSSAVASALAGEIDVTQIYSTGSAFAALRADGSVVTWGWSGGNSTAVASALAGDIDVTQIYSTEAAFAALRADGSVITWGHSDYGGDSSAVASQLSSGVVSFANVATDDVFQATNKNNIPIGTATALLTDGLEDTAYLISTAQLSQGFTDTDDDALIVQNLTADKGSISHNKNGSWSLIPSANYHGMVTLTYTISDDWGGTIAATQHITVNAVNDLPTGSIALTGTAKQGETLTATSTLADADGLGTLSYQWQANSLNVGTGSTYTLSQADVGKTLTVTASYTDLHGTYESKTSTASLAVIGITSIVPGILMTKDDVLIGENGDTALINVSLSTAPTREVSIRFLSNDNSEGLLSNATLNFTASNWFTPQTLTVSGQNDYINDGNQPFIITADINSADVNYRQLLIDPIVLTNKEDTTTEASARIPINTVRDTPLKIYGDVLINVLAIDSTTGLFEITGSKPINDVFYGLDGHDTLYGGNLQDDLSGGIGNDELYGENDEDFLYGEAGHDTLFGGLGKDTLDGGTGNDVLTGGIDDLALDVLIGGAGNDVYYLGYGKVDLVKDNGLPTDDDTVIMPYQLSSYTLPLGIETGTISTGTAVSNLMGNNSPNTLTGNEGNNNLNGASGNDSLLGGAGDDVLLGGKGNDILQGGIGRDILLGGAGKDRFVFDSELRATPDKINDFNVSDDTIILDNKIFSHLTRTGTLNANQFVKGAKALDSNDYLLYTPNTGVVSYDADGNGTGESQQIALLGANKALTYADFMVI